MKTENPIVISKSFRWIKCPTLFVECNQNIIRFQINMWNPLSIFIFPKRAVSILSHCLSAFLSCATNFELPLVGLCKLLTMYTYSN